MAVQLRTDRILFFTVLAIVMFGIVMLYSASSVMAEAKHLPEWYFVARQFLWMIVAVAVMIVLKNTDYRRWQSAGVAFSAIGVMIILLVAVYFLDPEHHRWLRAGRGGLIGLQPSELAKPALVVFLAFFVTLRAAAINSPYTLIPASLAVGFVIFAVAVADLGTAVVLGVTATVVLFVAGMKWRYLALALALALVGGGIFIGSKPYRVKRLLGYAPFLYPVIEKFDPHHRLDKYLRTSLTTEDTGYQGRQSRIAIGSGGPLGLGLGEGRQKLLYLPEAHTDFILAIIGEELGLIGTIGVLACFVVIFWRGIRTTVLAPDPFGKYLALGLTVIIVVQAFMNMTSVLGMMPTKGIPLPLISSGGSSLVSTMASLGILMNVSEHVG